MVAALSDARRWSDLVWVFRDARAALARDGNDFSWSSWMDATAALAELDALIADAGDHRLDELAARVLFAATGPIQEVSLSSGWGEEFLGLADRFDAALARL